MNVPTQCLAHRKQPKMLAAETVIFWYSGSLKKPAMGRRLEGLTSLEKKGKTNLVTVNRLLLLWGWHDTGNWSPQTAAYVHFTGHFQPLLYIPTSLVENTNMQHCASPFTSNILKVKKQNEEGKWKIVLVLAVASLHRGVGSYMGGSSIHGNPWACLTKDRKPGAHRRSCEGRGAQKELAEIITRVCEQQEPALGWGPKLLGGSDITWGRITSSPNSLSEGCSGKRKGAHWRRSSSKIYLRQPRNEHKELCSNQGNYLPLGSKMLPRSKPVKKQTSQLTQFSHIFQEVLFKHSLCFLLQLFDKVKYHFQDNEKIKTILETLPKLNYTAHSLDLANIFLPAVLSFIKI